MEQSHWLISVAKNCDWCKKIMSLSNLTRASPLVEWKLTAKAEFNWVIYKCWRKSWKIATVFVIRVALWAEKLGRCLEYCGSWKHVLWKLAVAVNTGRHSIKFEFWMNGALAMEEICVLCLCRFLRVCPWENQAEPGRRWYSSNHRFCSNLA